MLVAQLGTKLIIAHHKLNRKQAYCCPVCQTKVILKLGTKMIPHFAHQTTATCISSEAETPEHLAGKVLLQLFFPQFQLEVYLPELKQRADLLWEIRALEFQCSPLSFSRFLERTYGYLTSGYQPVWIFGKALQPQHKLTQLQKACLYFESGKGFYLYGLDVKNQSFLLFRHLHWSYETGLSYQKVTTTLIRKQQKSVESNRRSLRFSYRQWLAQQLVIKRKDIVKLQGKCYQHNQHLCYLAEWIYQESTFGLLFEHAVLYYRTLFVKADSYIEWRALMTNEVVSWSFPFLDKEVILHAFFAECTRLATSCKSCPSSIDR